MKRKKAAVSLLIAALIVQNSTIGMYASEDDWVDEQIVVEEVAAEESGMPEDSGMAVEQFSGEEFIDSEIMIDSNDDLAVIGKSVSDEFEPEPVEMESSMSENFETASDFTEGDTTDGGIVMDSDNEFVEDEKIAFCEFEVELIETEIDQAEESRTLSATSGTCGDNLTWVLDEEGTLTISGTGAMDNYEHDFVDSPWYSVRSDIITIVIKDGATTIGNDAFSSCDNLTSITLPGSVTTIGIKAFRNCSSLTSITIPNGVITIRDGAFESCSNLTSITIPDGVTTIAYNAFQDCSSLTSIMIPNSVTAINADAFSYCSSLTSITLPNSVSTIEYGVFRFCVNLTSITIPDSVDVIEDGAFSGCRNLSDVYYGGNKTEWDSITIREENDDLINATIHYGKDEPECNHEFKLVIDQNATCTAPGKQHNECTKCGYQEETVDIPAAGHSWNSGAMTKEATCIDTGVKTYTCIVCGTTKTETIAALGHGLTHYPATADRIEYWHCSRCGTDFGDSTGTQQVHIHSWGEWSVIATATVFEAEQQSRTCSACSESEIRTYGAKLAPTLSLNANSLKMKKKQSTKALKVSGMANGDYVKSVTSSKKKVLKVSGFSADGTIRLKAQKKTGKAKLTITLASGLSKTITVKVQSGTVKTTKVKVNTKKITLKKGEKTSVAATIKPITSQQKTTYTSSNKKVATVTSRGVVKAKKAGTAKITVKSGKKKVTVTVKVTD